MSFIIAMLPLPFIYFAYTYQYASLDSLVNATDMKKKFLDFGKPSPSYTIPNV